MSRRNIILLVLFLLVVSFSITFYFYTKNQSPAKTAEQLYQEAVVAELNSFKRDPTNTKSQKEVIKELNSFKAPIQTKSSLKDTLNSLNNFKP